MVALTTSINITDLFIQLKKFYIYRKNEYFLTKNKLLKLKIQKSPHTSISVRFEDFPKFSKKSFYLLNVNDYRFKNDLFNHMSNYDFIYYSNFILINKKIIILWYKKLRNFYQINLVF